jgi:penicillin-binding protein 2
MAAGPWLRAQTAPSLSNYFEGAHGTALLVDVPSRRLIAVHAPELASTSLAPPGSALKPFAVAALVESGKLRAHDGWRCPGDLAIGGRSFACSHPPVGEPMEVHSALAYSCNCFVAHFAERFALGELPLALGRYGLVSRTGWFGATEAAGEIHPVDERLQAIGEDGIAVTPAGLAMAYRRLALSTGRGILAPVLAGLEEAVEYGTAQRARVDGWKVAGKTGTARTVDGARVAWFAGFAPSRSPAVALTVMLQARTGGGDAAPIAGRILAACREGRL